MKVFSSLINTYETDFLTWKFICEKDPWLFAKQLHVYIDCDTNKNLDTTKEIPDEVKRIQAIPHLHRMNRDVLLCGVCDEIENMNLYMGRWTDSYDVPEDVYETVSQMTNLCVWWIKELHFVHIFSLHLK